MSKAIKRRSGIGSSSLIAAGDLNHMAAVDDDDTVALPLTPNGDMAVLNDKYRYAYVEFREDESSRDSNNIFVATLEWSNAAIANKAFENDDLSPSFDFWHGIVVQCYQSHHTSSGFFGLLPNKSNADADPDRVYHAHAGGISNTGDIAIHFGGTASTKENVSTLYRECCVDYLAQVQANYWPGHIMRTIEFMEARTIAHEVGHQFGLPDVPITANTLMSPWDGGDRSFDGGELAAIRGSVSMGSHSQ